MGCSGKLPTLLRAWTLPCRAGLRSQAGMLVPLHCVTACSGCRGEGATLQAASAPGTALGVWGRILGASPFLHVLTPVNQQRLDSALVPAR